MSKDEGYSFAPSVKLSIDLNYKKTAVKMFIKNRWNPSISPPTLPILCSSLPPAASILSSTHPRP